MAKSRDYMAAYRAKKKAEGGGNNTLEKAISKTQQPINEEKAGKAYQNLPKAFKDSIKRNLQLNDEEIRLLRDGEKITPEWQTGIRGAREKIKVFTNIDNGKVSYTIKQRNKILLKTDNKNRVANNVAQFYQEQFKKTR